MSDVTCPSCGTANPSGAKFCGECGTKLADLPAATPAPTAMAGERRTVTMLFCDVTGSTAAAEALDPEDWSEIMNGAFALMIEPVGRYEGTVARLMGDAILAFFGAPVAHEDDPQRAVLAGLDIVAATRGYRTEMQQKWGIDFDVRVGINTGLVVVGEVGTELRGEYTALGDAVNLAARMEQTADPGTVRIAPDTYRLVAPLFDVEQIGPVEVKGKHEPIPVYRVLGPKAEPGRLRGIEGLRSPLVGRDRELSRLRAAIDWHRAGAGGLCSVVGEAGLGKSRLVAEAKELAAGAGLVWAEGRSYSYETQTPYAPFLRLLRDCIGLRTADDEAASVARVREHLGGVLGADSPAATPFLLTLLGLPVAEDERALVSFADPPVLREKIFGAVIAYLGALAAITPLVVVLEDLHWADPSSIELIDRLMPLTGGSRLLIIGVSRPRTDDASWQFHERALSEFGERHVTVELRPLDEAQSRELVSNLLEIEGLPDRIRQLILDKSEGNPFFVEEVIRSLLDAGVVVQDGPYWRATKDIEDISVPDTLVSVLTTRLDLLDDTSKLVACSAAVIGRRFDDATLTAIVASGTNVGAALETLTRRGLVRADADGYSFKHVLTQQTAYEATLLSDRRALHLRLAERIEATEPDRVYDLARHFVEARAHARALPHLVAAGHQAFRAFSLAEATSLFRKAVELFGPDDDTAIAKQAYEGLIECLGFARDPGLMEVLSEAGALAESRGDVPLKVMALNRGAFFTLMGTGMIDVAGAMLAEAEEHARAGGDLAGLADMHTNYCMLNVCAGELQKANDHLAEAIEVGTELGSDMAQAFGRTHHANTLLYMTKFDEAEPEVLQALEFAERSGQLPFLSELKGETYPMVLSRNGRMAEARASSLAGLDLAQKIGSALHIVMNSISCAQYAMAAGDWEQALQLASVADGMAAEMGMALFRSSSSSMLATIAFTLDPSDTATVDRHEQTCAELESAPLGQSFESSVMCELGFVALGRGDVEAATERFGRGLSSCSSMAGLAKPGLLAGGALASLAAGRLADAAGAVAEATAYVDEKRMENCRPIVALAAASSEVARECPEQALQIATDALERAEGMGMLPLVARLAATGASAAHSLGRDDRAEHLTHRVRATIDAMATLIEDPDRRETYRTAGLAGAGIA